MTSFICCISDVGYAAPEVMTWTLIGSFFLAADDFVFLWGFWRLSSFGDNGDADTKVACFSLVSIWPLAALIFSYPESSKSLLSARSTVKFPAFQVAPSLCYPAEGAGTFTTLRLHSISCKWPSLTRFCLLIRWLHRSSLSVASELAVSAKLREMSACRIRAIGALFNFKAEPPVGCFEREICRKLVVQICLLLREEQAQKEAQYNYTNGCPYFMDRFIPARGLWPACSFFK